MNLEKKKLSVAFVTLATNKYVWYWKNLLLSADLNLGTNIDYTFHVFTDQPKYCEAASKLVKHVRVIIHEIRPMDWKDATLLRYETINSSKRLINSEIVVHIDADSLIIKDLSSTFIERDWINGIALVSHPGFWRPKGIAAVNFYIQNIQYLVRDSLKMVTMGALGTWDTNQNSTAYVARFRRKKYVCGGVWMGERDEIFRLIEELSNQNRINLENQLHAKWFDESHLNNWAAFHKCTKLTPNYCFAQGYKNLESFSPIIIAVDKKTIFPPSGRI
ncbi:Glycosyl transferase, family 6 [actinobacterium SCGC AAA044-D11]